MFWLLDAYECCTVKNSEERSVTQNKSIVKIGLRTTVHSITTAVSPVGAT